ncbi:hypothetical protein F5Y15DRAFT_380910 [Xylariaceae sp. FL0016]|nr:hypothetical protein F5Y15DRAFT_380910 [Xylariaceae sp. FL0016]
MEAFVPYTHMIGKHITTAFGRRCGMGVQQSSPYGDNAVSGDQARQRAAKRRRIAEATPETAPLGALGSFLRENPDDFEQALRIDVLRLHCPGETDALRPNGLNGASLDPVKTRIRCKVMVCLWRSSKECRVLYADSQFCDISVRRDPNMKARIHLPEPFYIPADKLWVEREDGSGFGLEDEYLIQVELESAGDPRWPPLDILPKDETETNPQSWVIGTGPVYSVDNRRKSAPIKIRKRINQDEKVDSLHLEVVVKWATSHTAGSTTRLTDEAIVKGTRLKKDPQEIGALAPLTNGRVNGRVDHSVNGHSEEIHQAVIAEEDDHDHDQGEAITPSRSLRTRENSMNYNLKLLSDKARGKERKERKQRKLANAKHETGRVVWILPQTGEVPLENYVCIRCYTAHASMEQLIEHLGVHEGDFKFSCDRRGFRIWVTKLGQETPRQHKSAMMELSSPEGHVTEEDEDISPQKQQRISSRGRSSQSSHLPSQPKDSRQRIPSISQPIFDRLSKAPLKHGSLVDPPPADDTWLVQKHRDIIRDYSDVEPNEKEYIVEWDAFVNRECVTSEPHLQDVYRKFVDTRAPWIVASQNRTTEWAKHLNYLKARGALTEETVRKTVAILRRARSHGQPEILEPVKPPSPRAEYRKSKSGCAVCGQPVRGPSTLICSNLNCDRPLYHTNCIREDARQPVESRNWHCNGCCKKRGSAD